MKRNAEDVAFAAASFSGISVLGVQQKRRKRNYEKKRKRKNLASGRAGLGVCQRHLLRFPMLVPLLVSSLSLA